MITTAEYYDSAFKSKIDQNMIGIFAIWSICLLPTRADFGSAKVLAARVVDLIDEERSLAEIVDEYLWYLLGGVCLPYLRVIDTYELNK